VFQRRTGLDGKWEGRITSDRVPRVIELAAVRAPSVPSGPPQSLSETRILFGTLEHKGVFNYTFSPEERLAEAQQRLKPDKDWLIDKVIPESPKTALTIVAKWVDKNPLRQALPDGITSHIATHVEKGIRINEHRIKYKGANRRTSRWNLSRRPSRSLWRSVTGLNATAKFIFSALAWRSLRSGS
jgi:hypothetical protein